MLKASALCAVPTEEREAAVSQISVLPPFSQDILIESSGEDDVVPESVISLAYRMMEHDETLREILNDLRSLYIIRREDFHIPFRPDSPAERDAILGLFQDMVGIISSFRYSPDCNMLNGTLLSSPRAQRFINGQYLELALHRKTDEVLKDLAAKHGKTCQLYRNVKVTNADGLLRNEFDLVIVYDSIFYVIEIKSGKNFRDFGKYIKIGREYGIVPDHFLLVDNFLTADQAETAEYFCDYFVTNLQRGSFARKLTAMIEKGLKGDQYE